MADSPATTASPDVVAKVSEWYSLKAQIAELAARENELRRDIFATAFPDAGEKGTYRLDVGHGKDLKGTAKLNYTVDREAVDAVLDGLPAETGSRLFRLKYEIVESELLRITNPEQKALVATCVTSKPGMPAIEVVDQKKRG